MSRKFLTPIGVLVSTSDPASGSDGDMYFNSSAGELRVYHNGTWTAINSSDTVRVEPGAQLSTSWWLGA